MTSREDFPGTDEWYTSRGMSIPERKKEADKTLQLPTQKLYGHPDIPKEDMDKIYKSVEIWNEKLQPWILKGMVRGYLLAIGKLPRYYYDDVTNL